MFIVPGKHGSTWQAWQHAQEAESSQLYHHREAERANWKGCEAFNLKALPPLRRTSSGKAAPPRPPPKSAAS